MSELCVQTNAVPYYILGVFEFCAAFFIGSQFYRFLKVRGKERTASNGNKIIFNLSCAFFGMILFAFIFMGLGFETYCGGFKVFLYLGQFCYFAQYLVLFGLLFYRLDVIFRGTKFPVTACTKRAFYGSYVLTIITMVLVLMHSMQGTLHTAFAVVALICFFLAVLTFIVMLIGPFIHKIRMVSKSVDNTSLMTVVIKTFILSIASIISLVIVATTIVLNAGIGHSAFSLVFEGVILISDQITNFSSIFLGFSSFEKDYMKVCGCWHRCCVKCCSSNASFDGTKGGVASTTDQSSQPPVDSATSQQASRSDRDETQTATVTI